MEQSKQPRQSILIVGGGISGLAAAHRATEKRPGVRVQLWEKASRMGGVLSTRHDHGYQVEESADNFITTTPHGIDLCRRLGLTDQLVQTNPQCRRVFVVHRGRLHKLPDGFLMMAPTKMWPLAVTPLLSPWGKFRAGLEYFIRPRRDDEDESMASFGRRRLGREAFERLVEPLVSGVYGADMEKLSVLATLPRFREMEKRHGSMIRAMRVQMAEQRAASRKRREQTRAAAKHQQETPTIDDPEDNPEAQSGARYSLFVTLREGLGKLILTLASRLPRDAVQIGRGLRSLERADGRWIATSDDGHTETFDAVVLATPSYETSRILTAIDAPLAAAVGRIEHTGTAIATVAFDRRQVQHPLDGAGFVVPAVERCPLLAASFSNRKYPHRAPDDKVLIRLFAGGARAPEMAEMPDDRLLDIVVDSIARLLKIEGKPHYTTVAHWPRTMPQYHVGHLDRVAAIEARVAELPGLALAGNAYHGVGVPACIHSGEKAIDRLLEIT